MADVQQEEAAGTDRTVPTLDDDKQPQEGEFEGATLHIESETHNVQGVPEVEIVEPRLSRNRPGSVIGRQSIRSTTSRTSMKPGVVKNDASANSFFSYKVFILSHIMLSCFFPKYLA